MTRPRESYDDRYPLLNHPYLHYGQRTVSTAFTAITDGPEAVLLVDTTPLTITLPLAADSKGYAVYVKKTNVAGSNVTVAATVPDLIDGAATQTISAQFESMLFVSDGAAWWILAHNP